MVVYFVDGNVRGAVNYPSIPDSYYYVVDAAEGYSRCMDTLRQLDVHRPGCPVLTNFTGALNPSVCYNFDAERFNVYFVSSDVNTWINVHNMIDKDLECESDLESMFKVGLFDTYRPEYVKLFTES